MLVVVDSPFNFLLLQFFMYSYSVHSSVTLCLPYKSSKSSLQFAEALKIIRVIIFSIAALVL